MGSPKAARYASRATLPRRWPTSAGRTPKAAKAKMNAADAAARSAMRAAPLLAVLLAALPAGCSFAPHMQTPPVPVADSYKELDPWITAQRADQLPRDAWWTLYGDSQLDELEKRLIDGSPDLAAALARYQQ